MDRTDLLFRAKRLSGGRWITGTLVHVGDYMGISEHRDCYEQVSPPTLCMFTGTKDADGYMVFEGDYVTARQHRDAEAFLWEIVWTGAFTAVRIGADGSSEEIAEDVHSLCDMHVAGNVHDHRVGRDGKITDRDC